MDFERLTTEQVEDMISDKHSPVSRHIENLLRGYADRIAEGEDPYDVLAITDTTPPIEVMAKECLAQAADL